MAFDEVGVGAAKRAMTASSRPTVRRVPAWARKGREFVDHGHGILLDGAGAIGLLSGLNRRSIV
jgi:hypothetical protein